MRVSVTCFSSSVQRLVTESPCASLPDHAYPDPELYQQPTAWHKPCQLSSSVCSSLEETVHLITKERQGKKIPSVTAQSWKLPNGLGTQAAYQFFCFGRHLGRFILLLLFSPLQVAVFHLLWDAMQGFLSKFVV